MEVIMAMPPRENGPILSKLLLALVHVTIALAFLAEAVADVPVGVTPITLSSTALPTLPSPSTFNRGSHNGFSSGFNFSMTATDISTQIDPTSASLNSSSTTNSTQGFTSADDSALSSSSASTSSEPAKSSEAVSTTSTSSVEVSSAASDATDSTKATSTTTITVTASRPSSLSRTSYTSTETNTVTWSWKKTEPVTITVTEASSASSLESSATSTGSRPNVSPIVTSSSSTSSLLSSTDAGFFKPTGLNSTSTTGAQPEMVTAPSFSVPTITDNIVFSTSSSTMSLSAPTNMSTTRSEPSIVTAAPESSSAPFPNNNYTTVWESFSSWLSAHSTEGATGSGSSPSLSHPPLLNTTQATSPGSSSPPVLLTTSHPSNFTFTSNLPSGVWISLDSQGIPFSVSSYVSAGRTFQSNLGVITTTCIPTTTVTAAPAGTVSTTRVFLQCGPGMGPQVTDSIATGAGMHSTQPMPPKPSTTSPSLRVTASFPPSVASSSTPSTTITCTLAPAVCKLQELSTMSLSGPSTAAAGMTGTTPSIVTGSKVMASVPTTFSTSTIVKRDLGRGVGLGNRVDDGRRVLGRLFWV